MNDGALAPTAGHGSTAPVRTQPAIPVRGRAKPAAITIGVLAAVLLVVQVVNSALHYQLNDSGIRPRSVDGLWGVADAPLLHTSWAHLASNIVPFAVLGFVLLLAGIRQFVAVTVLVWVISGLGVWLTAGPGSVTVGASTLVFGWLTFLVLRGLFTRSLPHILLGVLLLAIWGGVFWGVLPGRAGISWQGHLFGALAGALAACLVARADRPRHRRGADA